MFRCEDFPCCGHEMGDCDGSLYGSDAHIQATLTDAMNDGHAYCDHEAGLFNCDGDAEEEDEEYDEEEEYAAHLAEMDVVAFEARCYDEFGEPNPWWG